MSMNKVVSPYRNIPDTRSAFDKYVKRILLLLFGGIFGVYTIRYIRSLGSNSIGFALVDNGILILLAAILMIIGSQIEKSKIDLMWNNYESDNSNFFLFRLLEKSYALIIIKSIRGKTECKLGDFFPVKGEKIVTRLYFSREIGEGESFVSPIIELPKGEYHVSLNSKKTIFSFGYLFYYKPYEILYSIGLTLAEVSIPLVISGLILIIFNQNI